MTYTPYPTSGPGRQSFSIISILAIVAAVCSFLVGAGLGFLLAAVAIILGLIGVVMSLSPSVRGGMISILSIVAGVIGIIAAIVRLVL